MGKIGDEGAKAIAQALQTNTSLQNIDMRKNPIGKNGAVALWAEINKSQTIQKINCIDVKSMIKNSTVSKLILNEKDLYDFSAILVAEALKTNTSLQNIDMRKNPIGKN